MKRVCSTRQSNTLAGSRRQRGKSQFSGRDLGGEHSVEIQSGINKAGVKQQCSSSLVLPVPLW